MAASDRIEHPGRDGNDVAGLDFEVNKCPGRTRLAIVSAQSPSAERMPAVLDDGGLPDMGRMTV